MAKNYELDFKLQVVQRYDNQKEEYSKIAKEMGIDSSLVQRWVGKDASFLF